MFMIQQTLLGEERMENLFTIGDENMNEPLETIEETADFLKVKKSWMYKETRQKGADSIPCIRVGKYPRFQRSQVLAWLKLKQSRR